MRLITRRQFQTWLESQKSQQVVGISCDADDCPATRCLRELHKDRDIAVTQVYVRIDDTLHDIPVWLMRFILKIDEGPPPYVSYVTAGEALEILKSVPGR